MDDGDGLVPEICATRESFYAPSPGMRERERGRERDEERAALFDLMHFPPFLGLFFLLSLALSAARDRLSRIHSILHGVPRGPLL